MEKQRFQIIQQREYFEFMMNVDVVVAQIQRLHEGRKNAEFDVESIKAEIEVNNAVQGLEYLEWNRCDLVTAQIQYPETAQLLEGVRRELGDLIVAQIQSLQLGCVVEDRLPNPLDLISGEVDTLQFLSKWK